MLLAAVFAITTPVTVPAVTAPSVISTVRKTWPPTGTPMPATEASPAWLTAVFTVACAHMFKSDHHSSLRLAKLAHMLKKLPTEDRARGLWLEPGLANRFKQPKSNYFATEATLSQSSRVLHLADVCLGVEEKERFRVEAVSKLSPIAR